MQRTEFWQLIDLARKSAQGTRAIPAWLADYLRDQSVGFITEFKDQLHAASCEAYDARLWAAAGLMLGFCSDDKFQDFRGWLIAQGKAVYEAALRDPDMLADLIQIDGDEGKPLLFEMSYAPTTAFRQKVGDDLADLPKAKGTPVLRNQHTWDGDQGKLRTVFPKLYAKYVRLT